jgi:phosphoribosylaminoimidazole carboxylase
MPRGVPVATVAINNSTNAGLLAVRILQGTDADLIQRVLLYKEDMKEEVMAKVERLETQGWEHY